MIKLSQLSKIYHLEDADIRALDGVNLEIESGEFVVILGPSGCGKSTLLNILGGMDVPDSGAVQVGKTDLLKLKPDAKAGYRREQIGMIFQKFNLIHDMSILENVALPLKFAGVGTKQQHEQAHKALERVGLQDRLSSKPGKLSGGQQQRTAIARALVNEPEILLCDEPTGNLDSKTGQEILELLHQLHGQGHTIILVTHNEVYGQTADRVVKMLDGKIVSNETHIKQAASRDFVTHPTRNIGFWAKFALALNNIRRRKLRIFLTAFGVAIGGGMIITLVSFVAGLQREALFQASQFQQIEQIQFSQTKAGTVDFKPSNESSKFQVAEIVPINDRVLHDLGALTHVKAAYPVINFTGVVALLEKRGKLNSQALPPLADVTEAMRGKVAFGRFFTSDDEVAVIIPHGLAVVLGYADAAQIIGQQLTLTIAPEQKAFPLTVTGVMSQLDFSDTQIWIPSATAANMLKSIKQITSENLQTDTAIYAAGIVQVTDAASVTEVDNEVRNLGYTTHSYALVAKTQARAFSILQALFGLLGGIALIVASLGIVNTMLMSILERLREIGIMKAVGARAWDIQTIFIAEALLIGLIGGVMGLILGAFGSLLAEIILNRIVASQGGSQYVHFYTAWYLQVGVVAFSMLIATVAGYLPALRGARLDPVNALRDE